MPKGIPNKRHTGEFKQQAVEYMRKHKLSCKMVANRQKKSAKPCKIKGFALFNSTPTRF